MTKLQSITITACTCALLYVGIEHEGYLAQAMLVLAGFNIHGLARYTITKGE